jgi:hypothetical protein
LGSAMFIIDKEVANQEGSQTALIDILGELVAMVRREQLLTRNDPFLVEAQCALEALEMKRTKSSNAQTFSYQWTQSKFARTQRDPAFMAVVHCRIYKIN